MKTSCLRLKLVELNFLVSFNTDDQSKSDVAKTANIITYFSFCLTHWLSKPWHFAKFHYFPTKICHFLNVSKWLGNLITQLFWLHLNNYKLGIFGCKIHHIYAKCLINKFINIDIILTTSIQGVICCFSTQLSIFLWCYTNTHSVYIVCLIEVYSTLKFTKFT